MKQKQCYDVNKRKLFTSNQKVVEKIKKKYNLITFTNNNIKMKYSKEKYMETI